MTTVLKFPGPAGPPAAAGPGRLPALISRLLAEHPGAVGDGAAAASLLAALPGPARRALRLIARLRVVEDGHPGAIDAAAAAVGRLAALPPDVAELAALLADVPGPDPDADLAPAPEGGAG